MFIKDIYEHIKSFARSKRSVPVYLTDFRLKRSIIDPSFVSIVIDKRRKGKRKKKKRKKKEKSEKSLKNMNEFFVCVLISFLQSLFPFPKYDQTCMKDILPLQALLLRSLVNDLRSVPMHTSTD